VDLIDDAVVKSIISGEPMTVEQKYRDPLVINPFCKLVVATNHLPGAVTRAAGIFVGGSSSTLTKRFLRTGRTSNSLRK